MSQNALPNDSELLAGRSRRRVRVLDDIVVNQIAAGEVVERPASVVKELLENALDAGATSITVVLDNGGQANIEVIDNGQGMDREDLLGGLTRFGTSKIEQSSDLERVSTLGFRGEALPSIASVSRMTVSTRPVEDTTGRGVRAVVEGGETKELIEISCQSGTHVQVQQLFWNVPARRRFLKSETTETSLVRMLIAEAAAAFHQVEFRLRVDGREVIHFPKRESFLARCEQLGLVGEDRIVVTGAVHTPSGPIHVQGLLGHPSLAIANGNRLRVLVNGRAVRDKVILRAARDAYGSLIRPGKFPVGILRIDLPPQEVDVNVHPQKAEVRFRSSDSVYRAVRSQVGGVLYGLKPVEEKISFPGSDVITHEKPAPLRLFSSGMQQEQPPVFSISGIAREQLDVTPGREARTQQTLSDFRFVGQVFECFLILESESSLVLVDMHAAHERIVFVRLSEQFAAGNVTTQALLVPEVVQMPQHLLPFAEAFAQLCRECGIDLEQIGDGQLLIRTLPAILGRVSAQEIVSQLIESFEGEQDGGAVGARDRLTHQKSAVVTRMACHGSIRRGRALEPEEVYALLRQLEEVEGSAFCPHGRPVVRVISEGELERMFARA